jgi:hypothetical protein
MASHLLPFGLNEEVAGINIAALRPAFHVSFVAPVHGLVETSHADLVLVITEIGAACISDAGRVLWEYAQDQLTSWRLEGDTLSLAFLDTPPARLNILAGPTGSG